MSRSDSTMYLFAFGPPELRVLIGWQAGALSGPFRSLGHALRGRRRVFCCPELAAEAARAGVPCGELPPEVVEARALAGTFVLWYAFVESVTPAAMRELLDAARELEVGFGGGAEPRQIEVAGLAWDVSLLVRDGRCAGVLARRGTTELTLRLERGGDDFASRALADAGWPVLPLPLAYERGRRRMVSPRELATLVRIACALGAGVPRIGERRAVWRRAPVAWPAAVC